MERRDRPVDAEVLSTAPDDLPVLRALVGPTGVGKTDLAVALAQAVGAEIISADSRQVYADLQIGAARPSEDQLEAVPHHFVAELPLEASFSAGRFAEAALERIATLRARGKEPLVVGGSTLYVEALLHGLSDVPPTSPETRALLERRLAAEGAQRLYDELVRHDPATAATLDPSKTQRLVRALEVLYDTGQPLSAFHGNRPPRPFRPEVVVLTRPRSALYARIDRRVDAMLEEGLLDENHRLLARGYDPALNPLRTIGYREPMAYLRGELTYAEMVRRLKRNSRRYAKRQLTWFRRHPGYRWFDLETSASPLSLLRAWWDDPTVLPEGPPPSSS